MYEGVEAWDALPSLAGATLPQYDRAPGLRTVTGGDPDKLDTWPQHRLTPTEIYDKLNNS